jgi:hypothetical protein
MRILAAGITNACKLSVLVALAFGNPAMADSITFSGLITQSTSDGTGPPSANPALDTILDGDHYAVTFDFTGSISAPGTYQPPGAILTFLDDSASPAVSETSFDSVSFSVLLDGGNYDLSLLGCLSTGSGCLFGNELAVNFSIPSSGLNSANVAAQTIFGLSPALDLLEDDGVTDIQATVDSYSYSGAGTSTVPEPSGAAPATILLAALAWRVRERSRRTSHNGTEKEASE